MKNPYITTGSVVAIVVLILLCLIGCGGCSEGGDDLCPALYVEDEVETGVIEQYHASFFPSGSSASPKNNPAVYVDFSDGITASCLSDDNNMAVYRKFLNVISTDPFDYYELSDDRLIPYNGGEEFLYFSKEGHKDHDGKEKISAPIDKAIEAIVGRDNLSVLITDGELARDGKIIDMPWASKAFTSWFSKGHELFIVYTDFEDTTVGGGPLNKHMYIMFFVPNGLADIRDKVVAELDDEKLSYDSLSYSTNSSDMFKRDYPNSSLPGAEKYLEYFTECDEYYRSGNRGFEFLDLTSAPFDFSNEGMIYYLRDLGNNNGQKENFPLVDHLKFDFKNKLTNYVDLKLKLVVHDVYDDFENWKKNKLARKHPPIVTKSAAGGDTLEPVTNNLIFDCVSTIDDVDPYDIFEKNVSDTTDSFAKILMPEFKYSQSSFQTTEKGIQDFLEMDTDAGWNNEVNLGLYEVLIKFSPKLDENNPYLNQERPNLFRVDVVLEDASLNQEALNKDALTWIDKDGATNTALHMSLKNVLKDNKPSGVLYSYYIKLGPFNQ